MRPSARRCSLSMFHMSVFRAANLKDHDRPAEYLFEGGDELNRRDPNRQFKEARMKSILSTIQMALFTESPAPQWNDLEDMIASKW